MSFLSNGHPVASHLKRRPTPLAPLPWRASKEATPSLQPPTSPPLSHQDTTFHLRECTPDPRALTDSQRPSDIAQSHHQESGDGLLSSMTTQGAQSPTTIHFSIDGRGILEARHIWALHIPYEPWI
ncbi:hypothetical protein AAG906_028228 [Vitis piasezkii]